MVVKVIVINFMIAVMVSIGYQLWYKRKNSRKGA